MTVRQNIGLALRLEHLAESPTGSPGGAGGELGSRSRQQAPPFPARWVSEWMRQTAPGRQVRSKERLMSESTETAILAGGCFWGVEELLRRRDGVISTRVGTPAGRTRTRATGTTPATPRRSRS